MESQQNESIKELRLCVSHEQYRRLLEGAIQIDMQFPWLGQSRYVACIAIVSDEGVWLKLG